MQLRLEAAVSSNGCQKFRGLLLVSHYFNLFIQNGFSSIAMESLQMYYSLDPPENQFFIRAHLCEALVLSSAEKGTQVL